MNDAYTHSINMEEGREAPKMVGDYQVYPQKKKGK